MEKIKIMKSYHWKNNNIEVKLEAIKAAHGFRASMTLFENNKRQYSEWTPTLWTSYDDALLDAYYHARDFALQNGEVLS